MSDPHTLRASLRAIWLKDVGDVARTISKKGALVRSIRWSTRDTLSRFFLGCVAVGAGLSGSIIPALGIILLAIGAVGLLHRLLQHMLVATGDITASALFGFIRGLGTGKPGDPSRRRTDFLLLEAAVRYVTPDPEPTKLHNFKVEFELGGRRFPVQGYTDKTGRLPLYPTIQDVAARHSLRKDNDLAGAVYGSVQLDRERDTKRIRGVIHVSCEDSDGLPLQISIPVSGSSKPSPYAVYPELDRFADESDAMILGGIPYAVQGELPLVLWPDASWNGPHKALITVLNTRPKAEFRAEPPDINYGPSGRFPWRVDAVNGYREIGMGDEAHLEVAEFWTESDGDNQWLVARPVITDRVQRSRFEELDDGRYTAEWKTDVRISSKDGGIRAQATVRVIWEIVRASDGSSTSYIEIHADQRGAPLRNPKTLSIADANGAAPMIMKLRKPVPSPWDV